MRKILFVLLAIIACVAQAQEYTKFLGVSFSNPNIESILLEQGKISKPSTSSNLYDVEFAGKNMQVLFCHVNDDKTQPIYMVMVCSNDDSWRTSVNYYNYFKNLYSQKYTLEKHIEKSGCEGTTLSESTYGYHNLNEGDGVYISKFSTPTGTVMITIASNNKERYPEKGYALIAIEDKHFSDINDGKENSKALDDI